MRALSCSSHLLPCRPFSIPTAFLQTSSDSLPSSWHGGTQPTPCAGGAQDNLSPHPAPRAHTAAPQQAVTVIRHTEPYAVLFLSLHPSTEVLKDSSSRGTLPTSLLCTQRYRLFGSYPVAMTPNTTGPPVNKCSPP